MIDLGVQVWQVMPPPAPNPTVPLINYHITDIHKNRSSNHSRRPRRPLRLFLKSSPTLTPPKHLHKYINLRTELLWLRPNAERPPQHPYLHRCRLGRNARLRRARTVTFIHRPSLGSSLQWASAPPPPLRHPRSHKSVRVMCTDKGDTFEFVWWATVIMWWIFKSAVYNIIVAW